MSSFLKLRIRTRNRRLQQMMASANPAHIKPCTLVRAYSDDLVARTNQKYGLVHSHDLDFASRLALHKLSVHGVNVVSTKCALAVKINDKSNNEVSNTGYLNGDSAEIKRRRAFQMIKTCLAFVNGHGIRGIWPFCLFRPAQSPEAPLVLVCCRISFLIL